MGIAISFRFIAFGRETGAIQLIEIESILIHIGMHVGEILSPRPNADHMIHDFVPY